MTRGLSGVSATHRPVMGPLERAGKREHLAAQVVAERPCVPRRSPLHIEDTPTGALTAPMDVRDAVTDPLPRPAPLMEACRTMVDGRRCGHGPEAHKPVGYEGRERCGCGCPGYRLPWGELAKDVGYVVGLMLVFGPLLVITAWVVLQLLATWLIP